MFDLSINNVDLITNAVRSMMERPLKDGDSDQETSVLPTDMFESS
jgi:hypothetical protein